MYLHLSGIIRQLKLWAYSLFFYGHSRLLDFAVIKFMSFTFYRKLHFGNWAVIVGDHLPFSAVTIIQGSSYFSGMHEV